jgi:adenylate cyclase
MSFIAELKRRNVVRVGAAYAVVAWLLIQVAETLFRLFGFGDAPARIVVIVLAIGFIPATVFAWAFELTPEGLKKDKDVDRSQTITVLTGKRLDRLIMVVLALALGYFALDKFLLSDLREAAKEVRRAEELADARLAGRSEALVGSYGDKSIAVLAFDDMSPERDQEYLSDGIAEELLNLLAKSPDLRVISRSSAFSYKGRQVRLPDVARELNVAHILEGSVRKDGNRIRVTAQLIEASTDTHLWSETYDRALEDIFAIQDEIAATVVAQLKATLLGEAPRGREPNPEAYALSLQARHLGRLGTAEGHEQSIALYEQALAVDPRFASAWADLARNYINQAGLVRPHDEAFALAREAVGKALAIDPHNGPAHARLGWIAMVHDRDLVAAAQHFEHALKAEPANLDIIAAAAMLLNELGRLDQAIELLEYATIHDPVHPITHSNLGKAYMSASRWDDAIASLRTSLRLGPQRFTTHYWLGLAMLMKGEAHDALEVIEQERSERYRLMGLMLVHAALGQEQESDAALAALYATTEWGDYYQATRHAFRNEADPAFEYFTLQAAAGQDLRGISADLSFSSLRDDPRWLPLLESIGESPGQLDAIEFTVMLPRR